MINLNKNQKIATIAFAALLLLTVLFLTPFYQRYYTDSYGAYYTKEEYGDFILIDTDRIIFMKLFMEIGLLTTMYLLSLLVLKSKNKSEIT